jgi:hypothetical protein
LAPAVRIAPAEAIHLLAPALPVWAVAEALALIKTLPVAAGQAAVERITGKLARRAQLDKVTPGAIQTLAVEVAEAVQVVWAVMVLVVVSAAMVVQELLRLLRAQPWHVQVAGVVGLPTTTDLQQLGALPQQVGAMVGLVLQALLERQTLAVVAAVLLETAPHSEVQGDQVL